MKAHIKWAIKGTIFIILLVVILICVNTVLRVNQFYNDTWPTTSTYKNFYKMKRDTVDVIFLGSSMAASAYNPVSLYETYGITSYNLSSEQQNMLVSYYWLKEALKYQKPKAVVLDTVMVFMFDPSEPLNGGEANTRMAIDPMRWSKNKMDAVHDICMYDENQRLDSFFFTNIRFHSRWTELDKDDFSYGKMIKHKDLKGYAPLTGISFSDAYYPFDANETDEVVEPVEVGKVYLDKIVSLCKEKEIDLILTKTPADNGSVERYNYMSNYAKENELTYVDFCESSTYELSGYDFAMDASEDGFHHNIWGAQILTSYIGGTLRNIYNIEPRSDSQWDDSKEYFDEIMEDVYLTYSMTTEDYLEKLKNERYTVLAAVKGDATDLFTNENKDLINALGIWPKEGYKTGYSYYAVIDSGKIIGNMADEKLEKKGSIKGGLVSYDIMSSGSETGNDCSIVIDGEEYSLRENGLNIVVYDNDKNKVISSKCF